MIDNIFGMYKKLSIFSFGGFIFLYSFSVTVVTITVYMMVESMKYFFHCISYEVHCLILNLLKWINIHFKKA